MAVIAVKRRVFQQSAAMTAVGFTCKERLFLAQILLYVKVECSY